MNPALLAALICCGVAVFWGSMTVYAASRKAKGKGPGDEG